MLGVVTIRSYSYEWEGDEEEIEKAKDRYTFRVPIWWLLYAFLFAFSCLSFSLSPSLIISLPLFVCTLALSWAKLCLPQHHRPLQAAHAAEKHRIKEARKAEAERKAEEQRKAEEERKAEELRKLEEERKEVQFLIIYCNERLSIQLSVVLLYICVCVCLTSGRADLAQPFLASVRAGRTQSRGSKTRSRSC